MSDEQQSSSLLTLQSSRTGGEGSIWPPVCEADHPASLHYVSPRHARRFGLGSCRAHHGEILQGVFGDGRAELRRGLVSLPFPSLMARAKFLPSRQPRVLVASSHGAKEKAVRAATGVLRFLGRPRQGGYLILASECPIGWGLGSSTADVVATIEAVADAYGTHLSPQDIGRLAVQSETASDSVMFEDGAVLFAQREGVVLEDFAKPLPSFDVVGVNADPTHSGIDTLTRPLPNYTTGEVKEFQKLRVDLRLAIAKGDARGVADVATSSAQINDRYLPKPRLAAIIRIAEDCLALGVQVAHTGSVIGILFDTHALDQRCGQYEAIAKFRELGLISYRFSSGSANSSEQRSDTKHE